jgi:hypothetical protein
LSSSTWTPSLYGLSQTLEGLILTTPCGSVSCRFRSWGCVSLQSFDPAGKLLRIRHPARPFSMFLQVSLGNPGRILKGFCNPAIRTRPRSVSSCVRPMLSWGFSHFHGTPTRPARLVSRRIIRSWSLLRICSSSHPKWTYSVCNPVSSGISCSRRCRPS